MNLWQKFALLFSRVFRNKLKKRLFAECFEGIDEMPILWWWKMHEQADYSFLLRKRRKLGFIEMNLLVEKWRNIYDEYLERFGFGEMFTNMLMKERKIALLRIRKMLEGRKELQTFIEIEEIELEEMKKYMNGTGNDFYRVKAAVEKAFGFQVDPIKTSVAEFFSYIHTIEKRK